MHYAVRDENGVMKATLPARTAQTLMDNAPGLLKALRVQAHPDRFLTLFELTDDHRLSLGDAELYLCQGDRIAPCE